MKEDFNTDEIELTFINISQNRILKVRGLINKGNFSGDFKQLLYKFQLDCITYEHHQRSKQLDIKKEE